MQCSNKHLSLSQPPIIARPSRHLLVRELFRPVLGDLVSAREPNAFLRAGILEELAQTGDAARTADDASVQADAHHLGVPGDAFAVQLIKGADQVCVRPSVSVRANLLRRAERTRGGTHSWQSRRAS